MNMWCAQWKEKQGGCPNDTEKLNKGADETRYSKGEGQEKLIM